MLSREEFDSVISVFMVELTHRIMQTKEVELRALPKFAPIMEECVSDLRDPSADASLLLYRAFGYVDEYVNADQEKVMQATYEAYQALQEYRKQQAEKKAAE